MSADWLRLNGVADIFNWSLLPFVKEGRSNQNESTSLERSIVRQQGFCKIHKIFIPEQHLEDFKKLLVSYKIYLKLNFICN